MQKNILPAEVVALRGAVDGAGIDKSIIIR